MIRSTPALLLFFTGLVLSVEAFSRTASGRKFFKYLPVPLWCYFLPTVLSTLGFIPFEHALYGWMSRWLLPACLLLLLIGTDLPSIFKLGRKALLAMLAGTLGIAAGGAFTFVLGIKLADAGFWTLPADDLEALWKGWGCLSGSWTGGSANMIAVRESLQTPESLFSNLILVDTVVAYSWMALLVFLSRYQDPIDSFLGAETVSGDPVPGTDTVIPAFKGTPGVRSFPTRALLGMLLIAGAFAGAWVCASAAAHLPTAGAVLNRMTWIVILATAIPLGLSFTPARDLERLGAGRTGHLLLLVLLTSIGARASLSTLTHSPLFILLGLVWVSIHGGVLLLLGKLFRIPVSLLATASQANVGGTVSAPIVAGVYKNDLASLGVILAVLGNIYGTAFGLFFSQICRFLKDIL